VRTSKMKLHVRTTIDWKPERQRKSARQTAP
jgi:hypothetical protein